MEKVVKQFTSAAAEPEEQHNVIEIDSEEEIDLQLLGVHYAESLRSEIEASAEEELKLIDDEAEETGETL